MTRRIATSSRAMATGWLMLAGTVMACSGDAVPDQAMSLDIANGTTLEVTVLVNGSVIETVAPGQGDEIPASRLPSLPWRAEARSPSGRQLQQLMVHSGDVHTARTSRAGSRSGSTCHVAGWTCGPVHRLPAPHPALASRVTAIPSPSVPR